jgi:antitoxin MazE
MKAKIIKIGNSKGIMLSKHLLNQFNLDNEVELIINDNGILITPGNKKPRAGWKEQFEEALANGQEPENEMLEGFTNDFDEKTGNGNQDLKYG